MRDPWDFSCLSLWFTTRTRITNTANMNEKWCACITIIILPAISIMRCLFLSHFIFWFISCDTAAESWLHTKIYFCQADSSTKAVLLGTQETSYTCSTKSCDDSSHRKRWHSGVQWLVGMLCDTYNVLPLPVYIPFICSYSSRMYLSQPWLNTRHTRIEQVSWAPKWSII